MGWHEEVGSGFLNGRLNSFVFLDMFRALCGKLFLEVPELRCERCGVLIVRKVLRFLEQEV